ncbi:MAG TPA: NACHT domain-containing protein [Jatrophihabitans sp.]|nr:NACHT domain-containing protein [Jatrophihabitans sp.]
MDAAAARLAADVSRIERMRLDELQVSYGSGMPVRFGDLVRAEEAEPDGAVRGALPSVTSFYAQLEAPRRLLVVGEPGAGKTVLVLHLLLDLLAGRTTSDMPVPVRCNAAGWNAETSLEPLLIGRLSAEYGVPERVAHALIDYGRILPVLDGLDEMDPPGQPPVQAALAIARLNGPPWRGRPIVVTCRSAVYEALRAAGTHDGISGCKIVALRALRSDEIAEWIQTLLDRDDQISETHARSIAPILAEIDVHPNGVLARALDTPWMLTLALSYVERADAAAMRALTAAESTEAITDLLFAAQVPIACAQQPGPATEWRYTEAEVQQWMHTLARHLSEDENGQPRNQVALHQLWLMAGGATARRLHRVLLTVVSVLSGGGLVFWLSGSLRVGLASMLVFGFLGWLAGGVEPQPERAILRTRRKGSLRARLVTGLLRGSTWGLFMGLGFGLATGLTAGSRTGLLVGLLIAPWAGSLTGLVEGLLAVPARFRTSQDASDEIRDDVVAGVVFGMLVGLGVGLPGAVSGLVAGTLTATFAGWLTGLTAICAPMYLARASVRYGCAVIAFRTRKIFASRPAKFLQWAVRTGLVRVTGTAYQIRHDTYRQWLVTRSQALDPSATAAKYR